MGIAAFDKAGLVPVAYAKVNLLGAINGTNSGLTSTRLSAGTYKITLPSGMSLDEASNYVQIQCWHYQLMNSVQQPDPSYILVQFLDHNSVAADCDFSIMIFSTVTPPVIP
jgi:hypothetical protein